MARHGARAAAGASTSVADGAGPGVSAGNAAGQAAGGADRADLAGANASTRDGAGTGTSAADVADQSACGANSTEQPGASAGAADEVACGTSGAEQARPGARTADQSAYGASMAGRARPGASAADPAGQAAGGASVVKQAGGASGVQQADSGAGAVDSGASKAARRVPAGAGAAQRAGRFLIVVPPLVGHVNPVVGVAAALAARGHEVAWAGHREVIGRLAGPGARVLECAVPGATVARPAGLRGPGALKFLWETFLIPLAEAMIPGVAAAVEAFGPDVMLVDQQAVGGAVVAMRRGVPWATSATTAAELGNPLASMPQVDAWVRQLLLDLEVRSGLPTTAASARYQSTYGDLRFSPHLVLAYSTAALSGDVEALHDTLRYVGPSIAERPTDPTFPWHRLPDDRRLVFASVGTANSDAGASFLRACAEAIGERPQLFGVVADPAGAVGASAVADNVLAVPHVPQLDVLRRASAAICHAGQNTVCEALYHGVPLVVAPIRDDQPVVAQQVVAAGAGVRIRFAHAGAVQIGAALDQVLGEPGFAAAAGRIGESFRGAGGADAAAGYLEAMLAPDGPGTRQMPGVELAGQRSRVS